MSHIPEDSDDMHCSLLEIRRSRLGSKITTQLVGIQSALIEQEKSLDFIRNLECLYFNSPESTDLSRCNIDASEQSRYVALSYTWQPSPLETDISNGAYRVRQRGSNVFEESPVRDSVLFRVKKYMAYRGVQYLWIDQHCIEQEEGNAKQIGMHAMDRVYSRSDFPVALLATTINSWEERKLLVDILTGQLVGDDGDGLRLSPRTTKNQASRALKLLKEIVSDTWFERAWTFQENYRAGTRMVLLIKCPLSNTPTDVFESLDGELCVPSAGFHEQATKLCLAYGSSEPRSRYILQRVGKYTVLLQRRGPRGENEAPKSMSPRIIADLAARKLTTSWERLTIAANCCQYSVRLNCAQLRANGHSLSVSMLALCLLNGEILANHRTADFNIANAKSSTVVKFLETQLLNLRPPYLLNGLTFNKGCRFNEVQLTEEGVQTKGHIWECGGFISTRDFRRPRYRSHRSSLSEMGQPLRLGRINRMRLKKLAGILWSRGEDYLHDRLMEFIEMRYDARNHLTFSKDWQVLMAIMIAEAIGQGKTLRTAHILNERRENGAIFIVENTRYSTWVSRNDWARSNAGRAAFKAPKYVFTSFCPENNDNWGIFDRNDLDRHVTMEVDLDNSDYTGLPRLFTGRWIYGLCFFDNCRRQEVVFPWPASLEGL
ncbi:heterokaryon incompatibility protein-domain-containing protein [Biscogniauxia mediterranea]|nr:heterokaryon incompatibility protein-domain-containing protein [Biscogniauxia mediterranea]